MIRNASTCNMKQNSKETVEFLPYTAGLKINSKRLKWFADEASKHWRRRFWAQKYDDKTRNIFEEADLNSTIDRNYRRHLHAVYVPKNRHLFLVGPVNPLAYSKTA